MRVKIENVLLPIAKQHCSNGVIQGQNAECEFCNLLLEQQLLEAGYVVVDVIDTSF